MAMTETITWNPIETAPKDGQLVLLCGGEWCFFGEITASSSVMAAWFSEKKNKWVLHIEESFAKYENPTHWAELPKGPTV